MGRGSGEDSGEDPGVDHGEDSGEDPGAEIMIPSNTSPRLLRESGADVARTGPPGPPVGTVWALF